MNDDFKNDIMIVGAVSLAPVVTLTLAVIAMAMSAH